MLLLAILWIGWCGLHSMLISRRAHELAGRILGPFAGAYRMGYVLFSASTLTGVLWYQFSLPQSILVPALLPVRLFQYALLIYGLTLLYLGARVYDMSFFLGITQWRNMRRKDSPPPTSFRTDGILARVRHPWYSGGIACLWGFGAVTDVFLLSRVILTAYLLLGAHLEEKRLAAALGERYIAYRRKVPMLFPRPRRLSRSGPG